MRHPLCLQENSRSVTQSPLSLCSFQASSKYTPPYILGPAPNFATR